MHYTDAIRQQARRLHQHSTAQHRLRAADVRPLHIFAVVVVSLSLLPLGYLFLRATQAGADSIAFLLSGRVLGVLANSLKLTAAVALSATTLGLLVAWLTTRTDIPLRRLWLISSPLPLAIPSFIGAIAYIALLGPRGIIQQVLSPLGVQELPSIYGFPGAWLVITLFTYPYVLLPARAALLRLDPAQEETARSLGHSRWSVFWRVTLPQLRPAIGTGMLFVALYTLSDFGAVALLRYNAFTRAIFQQYTSSFDRTRAAVLALVLVALALALVSLERRVASSARNYRAGGSSTLRQFPLVRLGWWRFPALTFMAALIGLGLIAPLAVLVSWATQAVHSSASPLYSALAQPAANTAAISAVTAVLVSLAGLPLALLARQQRSPLGGWLVRLAYLGNSLPGLVIALALVFFAATYLPALYQTLALLILGYAIRFLPLSIGATQSALAQVNPCYEEAGRSLGLPGWQVNMRITLPLVRPGILGGAALVFLNVAKELPATLLLAPTGFKTLTTQIWSAHNEAQMSQIGVPALLLIATSALALSLILARDRGAEAG